MVKEAEHGRQQCWTTGQWWFCGEWWSGLALIINILIVIKVIIIIILDLETHTNMALIQACDNTWIWSEVNDLRLFFHVLFNSNKYTDTKSWVFLTRGNCVSLSVFHIVLSGDCNYNEAKQ